MNKLKSTVLLLLSVISFSGTAEKRIASMSAEGENSAVRYDNLGRVVYYGPEFPTSDASGSDLAYEFDWSNYSENQLGVNIITYETPGGQRIKFTAYLDDEGRVKEFSGHGISEKYYYKDSKISEITYKDDYEDNHLTINWNGNNIQSMEVERLEDGSFEKHKIQYTGKGVDVPINDPSKWMSLVLTVSETEACWFFALFSIAGLVGDDCGNLPIAIQSTYPSGSPTSYYEYKLDEDGYVAESIAWVDTDPNDRDSTYFFWEGSSSGMQSVGTLEDDDTRVYDINGIRLKSLRKGLNIIQTKEGSLKVYHRR